ncbi:hypothetical protein Vretifemale_10445 [Volvox reticuliferus]|uniref:Uncharacterized protein n=1 Tax=Volvox reticuliferus TaxID=1737510 RepID=A0A8J4FNX4_9CHLO|nr:hypothetical protein Vretifemale_10445 [Volvox reticuliferus]
MISGASTAVDSNAAIVTVAEAEAPLQWSLLQSPSPAAVAAAVMTCVNADRKCDNAPVGSPCARLTSHSRLARDTAVPGKTSCSSTSSFSGRGPFTNAAPSGDGQPGGIPWVARSASGAASAGHSAPRAAIRQDTASATAISSRE